MSLTVVEQPRGHKAPDLTPAQNYPIVQTFGQVSPSQGWWGGTLAPNGYVYCSPFISRQILKINPRTRAISYVGPIPGTDRYSGFKLAANGCLYALPYTTNNTDGRNVLKLDPSDDSFTQFGTTANGTNQNYGAIVGNDGKIYGVPYSPTTVFRVDPETDTIDTFGSFTAPQCAGGALAPNGKIYCIPKDSTSIFVIDPATDTVDTITGVVAGSDKWEGALLAYNDRIYGIPSSGGAGVIEVNPANDTFRILNITAVDSFLCGLAPNKKMYGAPESTPQIAEIDTRTYMARTLGITGPYLTAGWAGLVLTQQGTLIGVPHLSARVLEISRIGQVTADMYTFPTNVAGLSGTTYNRHMNNA